MHNIIHNRFTVHIKINAHQNYKQDSQNHSQQDAHKDSQKDSEKDSQKEGICNRIHSMIPSGRHCTIPRSIHSRVHNRRTHSRIHDRIPRIILGLMHEGIRNRFIAGLKKGQRDSHQESERLSVGFAAGVRAACIGGFTQEIRERFKHIFASGFTEDSQQSSQRYS